MPVSLSEFFDLRARQPVIDVRSQGEFAAGHLPGAVNIPLLNDEERIMVGTAYKIRGQREAIKEGFRLVGPRLNEIVLETEKVSQGKPILVYCWRGGMRSGNFCQFVEMAGIKATALQGGYKTYRREALTCFATPMKLVLLTGFTGSGKSEILRELALAGEQVVDLEKLASHKGSAFGGMMMPQQPASEQFQNELFESILNLDLSKNVWVEDESLAIGKVFLPAAFWQQMMKSRIVRIDVSRQQRVDRLAREYGVADKDEFLKMMSKIVKKLGGQHYLMAREKLIGGDMHATIDILLTYYDKAYQESIAKRKDQVVHTLSWNDANIHDITRRLRSLQIN